LCLGLAASSAIGATQHSSKKTGQKKSGTVKPAGKPAAKRTVSIARKRKPGTYRRAGSPPRQQTPTPQRYSEIQQVLADKGFYKGPVNGLWGTDSVDALKRFQAAQNLSPDGKLGSLSLIALGLGPKRETASAKPPQASQLAQ
jgi:peptidoglycan hydrolase-like protein with peptidoglycan-binding domain